MDSLLTETTRLRTASLTVHTTSERLEVNDHWTVPKDTPILIFSHDTALDTEAWAKARPHSVDKPLEQYWAERFIIPDRSSSRASQRGQRNDIGPVSFSLEGLESLNISMGDFQQYLLGRAYVREVHAATIAVVLNTFELQPCDSDLFDTVAPPVHEKAFGILKPLEEIAVRIRKR